MRIWNQSGTRLLQHGNCVLPANRGKVPKKYLQRITGLQVIEECLDGRPGTREDWRTAVNLGVRRGSDITPRTLATLNAFAKLGFPSPLRAR